MKNKAFTLIEMLVVVLTIALLAALFLVRYRLGERRRIFNLAAQQVASDLRRAQNFAMAMEEQNDLPIYGYGVYFNISTPGFYVLFADLNDNNVYDDGIDKNVDLLELPSDIKVSQLFPSSPLNIFFRPPDPLTLINTDKDRGEITLELKNTGLEKKIYVTDEGRIGVMD